ncbi:hypothetical protein chiPu_0017229 [Chiloscyllium punctatum]|uniref:Uncharacterized protein n=1 Tax=Chiloscyllium punctatum TaxID=137246 RepID=A0A401T7R9_CHIPU|nr:hypothetical protein [Chiloscyllium punctatum]
MVGIDDAEILPIEQAVPPQLELQLPTTHALVTVPDPPSLSLNGGRASPPLSSLRFTGAFPEPVRLKENPGAGSVRYGREGVSETQDSWDPLEWCFANERFQIKPHLDLTVTLFAMTSLSQDFEH